MSKFLPRAVAEYVLIVLVIIPMASIGFMAQYFNHTIENLHKKDIKVEIENYNDNTAIIYCHRENNVVNDDFVAASGVFLEGKYILTAYHVVLNHNTRVVGPYGTEDRKLFVVFDDKEYEVAIVYTKKESDLAILEIVTGNVGISTPVNLENASKGDLVFNIANPDGYVHYSCIGRIAGEYADLGQIKFNSPVYIVDSTAYYGSSGSPVYDIAGKLIGIVSGVHTNRNGFTIVVPVTHILEVFNADGTINTKMLRVKDKTKSVWGV